MVLPVIRRTLLTAPVGRVPVPCSQQEPIHGLIQGEGGPRVSDDAVGGVPAADSAARAAAGMSTGGRARCAELRRIPSIPTRQTKAIRTKTARRSAMPPHRSDIDTGMSARFRPQVPPSAAAEPWAARPETRSPARPSPVAVPPAGPARRGAWAEVLAGTRHQARSRGRADLRRRRSDRPASNSRSRRPAGGAVAHAATGPDQFARPGPGPRRGPWQLRRHRRGRVDPRPFAARDGRDRTVPDRRGPGHQGARLGGRTRPPRRRLAVDRSSRSDPDQCVRRRRPRVPRHPRPMPTRRAMSAVSAPCSTP